MKRFISQILAVLLFTVSIFSQTEKQTPVLIGEFERVSLEDIFGQLDYFTFSLSKTLNTKGFIRIYGGNENCFLCHYRRGSLISAILTNTRNIPSDKYTIEFCVDNKEELRTQLYLMTTTAKLPDCNKTLEIPKKSLLFDKIYYYFDDNKLSPLEDSVIDVVGPAHGEYSRNTLMAVKNILDKSSESKIYVIVYLGTNLEEYENVNGKLIEKKIRRLDRKSFAKKMLLNAKNELIRNDIKPSQIETVDGGYIDDKRRLEFWFVPKGSEVPKAKPNYFPKNKRSKK